MRDEFLGCAEPLSSWTHLLGAGFFLVLAVPLIRGNVGTKKQGVALVVFALSAVLALAISGAYHLLPHATTARFVLRHLDHAAIFLLIAGTFTAVHTYLFHGIGRWGVLLVLWLLAVGAITLKMVFFRSFPDSVSTALYLTYGWLGVGTGVALWRRYGLRFIIPLVIGGSAYTTGALIELQKQLVIIPGVFEAHEVFHFLVLLGIGFHWSFVRDASRTPIGLSSRLRKR